MTVTHASLTGADLHEPKGVAAASSGQVYVANGAASGSWTTTFAPSGYTTTAASKNLNLVPITAYFPDIGTASSIWVVSPIAGIITTIYSTIHAATATTDTLLTASIGGVGVTNGVITVAFAGAAAGDVDSCSPSANRTVTAGQAIKILSDGGTAGVVPAMITIYLNVA